jgi:ArsR family transcriptional regulator
MAGRRVKKLYQARAQVMKALAQPVRMEIADLLSEGEMCVEDLARKTGAERSNVSRHLSVLAVAGIVESRKEGLKVFYSLKVP